MRDIPVKDWKNHVPGEQGDIEYYLHSVNLASEISAGGVEIITNLCIAHKVLAKYVGGYDHRLNTYSEDNFSGTALQTGRIRARLIVSGIIIFL